MPLIRARRGSRGGGGTGEASRRVARLGWLAAMVGRGLLSWSLLGGCFSPEVVAAAPAEGAEESIVVPAGAVSDAGPEPSEALPSTRESSDEPAGSGSEGRRESASPGGSGPGALETTADGSAADRSSPPVRVPRRPTKEIEVKITLDEAVLIALENNVDIRLAQVDLGVSGLRLVGERSVFDPSLTGGGTYRDNREPTASFLDIGGGALEGIVVPNPYTTFGFQAGVGGLTPIGTRYDVTIRDNAFDRPAAAGTLFGINPQHSLRAGVTVTQPLLRGAWLEYNTAGIRIARNTRRISIHQLEQTAAATVYRVEQTYWTLLFALKNYEAKAKALDVALENLDIAQRKRRVGTLAQLDVTITESQAAIRRVEFNEAQLLLENSRDEFLDVLNFSGQRSLREQWVSGRGKGPYDRVLVEPVSPPDISEFVPERDRSLQLAFDQRPEYKQVDLRIRNQGIQVDLRKNEKLPSLDLVAGWEQLGLDDTVDKAATSLGTGRFYSWSVGVQFEMPIFDRGPESRHREARETLRRTKLERFQLENTIVLEVDRAIRNLRSLHEKVQHLEERVRLQQQVLDAELKKLRVGKSINYTVSTIENDLIDSQSQALRAKADYVTAKAEYRRSIGSLLRFHRIELAP